MERTPITCDNQTKTLNPYTPPNEVVAEAQPSQNRSTRKPLVTFVFVSFGAMLLVGYPTAASLIPVIIVASCFAMIATWLDWRYSRKN
ncbi:MAG TPA: hypothetical protein DDZ51_31425 [Planctomycetaceae bacterium]|nr:hypothetical protein [Planctomycetaceae bacterium]